MLNTYGLRFERLFREYVREGNQILKLLPDVHLTRKQVISLRFGIKFYNTGSNFDQKPIAGNFAREDVAKAQLAALDALEIRSPTQERRYYALQYYLLGFRVQEDIGDAWRDRSSYNPKQVYRFARRRLPQAIPELEGSMILYKELKRFRKKFEDRIATQVLESLITDEH